MLGKDSVVPLHCQVGFTAEGPTGPLPWRRWVSMCFSFSWPPEQMAVTVSIVSSSLWNGANFGEHVLETNIWQSGFLLGGIFCLCHTWSPKSSAKQIWFKMLILNPGWLLWIRAKEQTQSPQVARVIQKFSPITPSQVPVPCH